MTAKQKFLMKEYFCCQGNLTRYEWGENLKEFSHRLYELISEIHGEKPNVEECWQIIEKIGSIQSAADLKMVGTMKGRFSENEELVISLKADYIGEKDLGAVKKFDHDLVFAEQRELADNGSESACKLWAYMNWLLGTEKGQRTAIQWWEILGVSGDIPSMKALVYAYRIMGDEDNSGLWEEATWIMQGSEGIFTPLSINKGDKCLRKEAVELAQLILCIKNRKSKQEVRYVDKYMSHYALKSTDPIGEKIRKLTMETDFYMVLYEESIQKTRSFIGFVSGF